MAAMLRRLHAVRGYMETATRPSLRRRLRPRGQRARQRQVEASINYGPQEVRGYLDLIDWLAPAMEQDGGGPACSASLTSRAWPKRCRAGTRSHSSIFAPFAAPTTIAPLHHGGSWPMVSSVTGATACTKPNYRSFTRENGEAAYTEAIALALRDEEIVAQPGSEALQNPMRAPTL